MPRLQGLVWHGNVDRRSLRHSSGNNKAVSSFQPQITKLFCMLYNQPLNYVALSLFSETEQVFK